jgi:hypothetical protein
LVRCVWLKEEYVKSSLIKTEIRLNRHHAQLIHQDISE